MTARGRTRGREWCMRTCLLHTNNVANIRNQHFEFMHLLGNVYFQHLKHTYPSCRSTTAPATAPLLLGIGSVECCHTPCYWETYYITVPLLSNVYVDVHHHDTTPFWEHSMTQPGQAHSALTPSVSTLALLPESCASSAWSSSIFSSPSPPWGDSGSEAGDVLNGKVKGTHTHPTTNSPPTQICKS